MIDASAVDLDDIKGDLFVALCDKYKNIKFLFDLNNFNKDSLWKMNNSSLRYFFVNPITTIDQMWGVLKYKPTDMYICEELGFSLDKVGKILHEENIKIRVFPNICQSSFHDTPSLQTFFIRPEDVGIYSTFVDVFELVSDAERQSLIYKIYKQGNWFGKIKEIIPSFKDDLDGRFLLDSFGMTRSICGKRCMYKPDSCNICTRSADLAKTLEDGHIIVQKKKNN